VTVVCPVCRDVVHTFAGCIVVHGSRSHGVFVMCAGSSTAFCSVSDCCSL